MTQVLPSYYPQFACTGSHCTDNCCIGWEIGLDAPTLNRWNQETGPLAPALQQAIAPGQPPCFRLDDQGRCPFLEASGLCQLQREGRADLLGPICREHPRFHNTMGQRRESGLGLCCEAAAQLILLADKPLELTQQSLEVSVSEGSPHASPQLLTQLDALRSLCLALVNHAALPFFHRLALLCCLAQDLQTGFSQIDPQEPDPQPLQCQAIAQVVEAYGDSAFWASLAHQLPELLPPQESEATASLLASFYQSLLISDPLWSNALERLAHQLPHRLAQAAGPHSLPTGPMERLAEYFLYRWCSVAVLEGDALGGLLPAVSGCLLVALLALEHPQPAASHLVELARLYSKQVEYCPENLTRMEQAIWQEDCFSPLALAGLLFGL